MNLNSLDFPTEGLDIFIRLLLDGITIPNEHKKKKRKAFQPISSKDILRIAFSTGRAGFSARIKTGSDSWDISFTRNKLRVWVNANWNTDPPSLEGDIVLSCIIRVVEEIRTRQFLAPDQILWLMTADPNTGILAQTEAEWLGELHLDHDLISPGDTPGIWKLSPYGWNVWRILVRS